MTSPLHGAEVLWLLFVGVVPAVLGVVMSYFVIRLAVRHALLDVEKRRTLPPGPPSSGV